MAEARFILRYRGEGPMPGSDAEQLRQVSGITVVEASDRMLLVEAGADGAEALRRTVESMDGWVMAPERSYPVPDTRPPHP